MTTSEHVQHVLIPLLSRVQGLAAGKRQDIIDGIAAGLTSLHHLAHSGLLPKPDPRLSPGEDRINSNWLNLALDEVQRLNMNGCDSITSLTEAIWKTQGIMNYWTNQDPKPYYFRGQHDYNWDLQTGACRLGLMPEDDPLRTTAAEIEALRAFQQQVSADASLKNDVFPHSTIPDEEDPGWWAHMQHYHGGTRLLDITSSPLCALWFACADWDGTVDETVDGAMYLLPNTGRTDTSTPEIIRGVIVGDDARPIAASEYFTVHAHPDTLRFRRAPGLNDRLLAQDGYFLWQPNFDESLDVGAHFKFRVSALHKKRILGELGSLGYTRDRIVFCQR